MRSRIVGALVFLSLIVVLSWWRSERAGSRFPGAAPSSPVQQVPVQPPRVQQPAAAPSGDEDVKLLVRQAVAAFRKMLDQNPQAVITQCTNAADCTAKVPGLKVPAGIKINIQLSMHGEVQAEAGRARSGRSYYYYDGAPSVELQNKEADEWIVDAAGNSTPIP